MNKFPGGFYSWDGTPCSIDEYTTQRANRHVVRRTQVNEFLVSTVHLGMNLNFWGGPPLIFESMVFDQHHENPRPWQEELMERYATEAQALEGHAGILDVVRTHPSSFEGQSFQLDMDHTPAEVPWWVHCTCGFQEFRSREDDTHSSFTIHSGKHWATADVP